MTRAARFCAAVLGTAVILCPSLSAAGRNGVDGFVIKDGGPLKEAPASASGAEGAAVPEEAPPSFWDRHAWEVGAEVYTVAYEEPGVMEQTGLMTGIRGAYAYHDRWMLKAELRLAQGRVDYTSSRSGSISGIEDAALEARALAGWDFRLTEAAAMTVFSGFGYRYLEDDSGGKRSSTGALGYKRESNYCYSPVGIEAAALLAGRWQLTFLAEYDHFWKGRQKSRLSDVDPGIGDLANNQNSGYGLRAALGLGYRFDWGLIRVQPFVRFWDIGDSERTDVIVDGSVVGVGREPANSTLETGLAVSGTF